MAACTAILEHAGTRPRRRATTTCEPCVTGTSGTRPQPVEAMSSTEMASLPTTETRAGAYEASDFR
eukprot:10844341-Heterocapsa_arctica.AAC.1